MTNPTQMPKPKTASPIPEAHPPKCPHCKADLAAIEKFNWGGGAWLVLAILCPFCFVLLHMQIFPVAEAAAADPGDAASPRIHIPS